MNPAARKSRFTRSIKVGLLSPYFSFFDERFPPDYRPSQERYADVKADALAAAGFEVTPSGLVDSLESAAIARARFIAASVDVVVVAPTMAAPPTYGAAALDGLEAPIILWDDRRVARFEDHIDEVDATRASSLLGSVMLANVLRRLDSRYVTVGTSLGEIDPVARAIRGAAAAAALRGARLGLIGGALPGYGDVLLDRTTAEAMGIELIDVPDDIISASLTAATKSARGWDVDIPATVAPSARALLKRSLRVHRFLESIVEEEHLDALTINCHSDIIRWGLDLGVVGCLGASLLGAAGVPVSCTGDASTSIALMLGARITGSAQYCEGYGVEGDTGELLLSSCGMGDFGLAARGKATVVPNDLYPGRHGEGCAVRFGFAEGPASMIAFGQQASDRPPRLVLSVGRLTGRSFAHLNGPSGMFAFDRPGSGASSRSWIDAGPAHHVALLRGDVAAEVTTAAAFLDVELVRVDGRRELTSPTA